MCQFDNCGALRPETLWAERIYSLIGAKLGWVEGVEFNFFGLVAGLDLRHPALKLPGFGRVGIDDGTALAAPAPVPAK